MGGSLTSVDNCFDICGDGKVMIRDFEGYCDDSNLVNGDGCSSVCETETGWICSGGSINSSDTC